MFTASPSSNKKCWYCTQFMPRRICDSSFKCRQEERERGREKNEKERKNIAKPPTISHRIKYQKNIICKRIQFTRFFLLHFYASFFLITWAQSLKWNIKSSFILVCFHAHGISKNRSTVFIFAVMEQKKMVWKKKNQKPGKLWFYWNEIVTDTYQVGNYAAKNPQ